MKTLLFDLESDGLLDTVTKIHCIAIKDIATNEDYFFGPDEVMRGIEMLKQADRVVGHNILDYDLRVIKNVTGVIIDSEPLDTLLLSRMLFPDNKIPKGCRGPHSLESWGVRFKHPKPKHEDWSQYSEDMKHRCKEDVEINFKLYKLCRSRWGNRDPSPIHMEHQVAKIVLKQQEFGIRFDASLAQVLLKDLTKSHEEITEKYQKVFPLQVSNLGTVSKPFKKSGEYTQQVLKHYEGEFPVPVAGPFTRIQISQINPQSYKQVTQSLLSMGWKPLEYNYKKDPHGKPLKDDKGEKIKAGPKIPNGEHSIEAFRKQTGREDIAEVLGTIGTVNHRLGLVKGLIQNVRGDGRIESQANTIGTPTARFTHRVVVNIPKAAEGIYKGKEFRSLFTCDKGRVLIGCDADALEARVEAHYTYQYDQAYSLELIEGDIHTKNAELFGISRNEAKTVKYALLYGCSAGKLETLGFREDAARQIHKSFWSDCIGLSKLKKKLENESEESFGKIQAIDGRPLSSRYKHSLVNTLFQSAGSIIMKKAWCLLDDALTEQRLDATIVGQWHDEVLVDCSEDVAKIVATLCEECLISAGKYYNCNVPITGQSRVGKTWADVH